VKACATGPVHPVSLPETQFSEVGEDGLSIKQKLRALFLGLILGIGSIAGMPMRVEEIENLMHSMNQTRVCQIVREEHDDSGGPPTT
jgi:hypothetical protein